MLDQTTADVMRENESLQAQVAQLREALYELHHDFFLNYQTGQYMDRAAKALAATPADAQAWLEKQRKLAAAHAFEQFADDVLGGGWASHATKLHATKLREEAEAL